VIKCLFKSYFKINIIFNDSFQNIFFKVPFVTKKSLHFRYILDGLFKTVKVLREFHFAFLNFNLVYQMISGYSILVLAMAGTDSMNRIHPNLRVKGRKRSYA
jgi:hypothetical protein